MRLFEIDGDTKNSGLLRFSILFQILLDIIQERKVKNNFIPIVKRKKILEIIDNKNFSPGRLACLNYLINFINLNFNNKSISVLDIGCGSGRYYDILKKIVEPYEVNYLGLDIKENNNWNNYKDTNVSFIKKDIQQFSDLNFDFKPDLIFSQSALEHAKDDIKILKLILKKYKNTPQLHLVPGAISGLNYLSHGYRRYKYNELYHILTDLDADYKITPFSGNKALKDYFLWFKKENENTKSYRKHALGIFFPSKGEYRPLQNIEQYAGILKGEFPVQYAIELNLNSKN